MVVAVNREPPAAQGLRHRALGPAIFGIAPIHDAAGNHIGSFEFGLDFGPILDQLKAIYGLDATLYVEEKPLRDFAQGRRSVDLQRPESRQPFHPLPHHPTPC